MAKQSIATLVLTVRATGAITANRLVTYAAAQAVADSITLGVARAAAASGELVALDVDGTTVVESGAAIAVGDTCKSDASGRAITWVTAGGKVGKALEAATAAGQFIEMRLLQNVA